MFEIGDKVLVRGLEDKDCSWLNGQVGEITGIWENEFFYRVKFTRTSDWPDTALGMYYETFLSVGHFEFAGKLSNYLYG